MVIWDLMGFVKASLALLENTGSGLFGILAFFEYRVLMEANSKLVKGKCSKFLQTFEPELNKCI